MFHPRNAFVALALVAPALAQDPASPAVPSADEPTFAGVQAEILQSFEQSAEELRQLREELAEEQVEINAQISYYEAELKKVRKEYNDVVGRFDAQTLNVSNTRKRITSLEDTIVYLEGQLDYYLNNLRSSIHISEHQRFDERLAATQLAVSNDNLSQSEVFHLQAEMMQETVGRLEELLGGTQFEGTALNAGGLVREGRFLLIGPAAFFRSADGADIGTAEERVGSLEPNIIPFDLPEDVDAADSAVSVGVGEVPFDTTLGNAHKIAATNETFIEHVSKGGAVMIPIFVMAGLALLVALFKWISMLAVRKPSRRKLSALMQSVSDNDRQAATSHVRAMSGPVGRMLGAGVQHMEEPRELIEEVMYEEVLTTRLKLNKLLPFIAICAASAPLMGLLGTVTGIINTFKMIEVFGSGDVKSLSGGISEALITTKFGLIVAIPSLLLHAYLSRKARGVVGDMETSAVRFVNQVDLARSEYVVPATRNGRTGAYTAAHPSGHPAGNSSVDPRLVRAEVQAILGDLLGDDALNPPRTGPAAS